MKSSRAVVAAFTAIVIAAGNTTIISYAEDNLEAKATSDYEQERADGPMIKSFKVSDPDSSDPDFSDNDVLIIQFSPATNQPGGLGVMLQKEDVDKLFSFTHALGNNYTGRWINPTTFKIIIEDATGNENPQIGLSNITVKQEANLTNAAGTSLPSTSTSPPLSGSFGGLPGPDIDAIVADGTAGYDANKTSISDGDTITVRFAESTNQPFRDDENKLTRDDVDNLFLFSQNLGNNYTGMWANPSTLVIRIVNATDAQAALGELNLTVKQEANLTNAAGTSLPSTSTSPPLSGSFGPFSVSMSTKLGGTVVATLPSGVKIGITTLFSSGLITISKIGEDTTTNRTGPTGEPIEFIGDVVDVSVQGNACIEGCGFVFTFSDDDIATSALNVSDIRILHDKNNDGDFNEVGEILQTRIAPDNPPGPYFAIARDSFNSKFAVGGIPRVGGIQATQ
jgi:hypothetical protein